MGTITAGFHLLFLIATIALHAHASSQEAHLTKFLSSKRSRSNIGNKIGDPTSFHGGSFLGITSSPRTDGYPGSDHSALKAADKISALPRQPEGVDFDQYGGYVTFDSHKGRALFYYFVESPGDPRRSHSSCGSTELPGYDPCGEVPTSAYLNLPAVQRAFHARETKWSDCNIIYVDFKDSPDSMVPTLKWLIDHDLPVWLFSGDLDSRCPITGTRYTVRDLNLSITEPWRPWTAGHEVGGYVQQYKGGFTFATVRGAGHTVPTFQPERALILLQSFLKGILPPYEKAK